MLQSSMDFTTYQKTNQKKRNRLYRQANNENIQRDIRASHQRYISNIIPWTLQEEEVLVLY